MPPRRSAATQLAKLLDSAAEGVYAVGETGRIVFFSQACAEWTGWPAADIVGQTCRYHSSPDVTGAAAAAAALCPPPEVFAGKERSAIVACPTPDGRLPRRRVRYVPLRSASGVDGVAAFVAPVGADSSAPSNASRAGDESPATDTADESAATTVRDEAAELHARLVRFRHEQRGRYGLDRLVGDGPAMRRVRAQVAVAADSDAAVLVVGPMGSGRTHVARTIHYAAGGTPLGALVPLSCSLLGGELLLSTVAATIRAQREPGVPRRATLLLTDAERMPRDMQAELARRLSAGMPLRVIATSAIPLVEAARRGEFRDDLAAALSTLTVELPPLTERLVDLPLLAQRFLEMHNAAGAKQLRGWSPEALDRLALHAWPGNVAELVEVARQAHAAAEGVEIISADLPPRLHRAADAAALPRRAAEPIHLEDFLAGVEKELIQRALAQSRGNKTRAARLLGMTRPRFYRRLVQLGLEEARENPLDEPLVADELGVEWEEAGGTEGIEGIEE